jgi:cytochrome c5
MGRSAHDGCARANNTDHNMRYATVPLALSLAMLCIDAGCAGTREADVYGAAAMEPVAMQRGSELYGRYCEGCHAGQGAMRPALDRAGSPALMHIQARVGMAAVPTWLAETLTHDDARLIVEYLGAAPAAR